MEPTTTRKIAGEVVRNLVGAKYGEYQAAPDELGMSLSTLYRLMDGETVRPIQYRKIERALDLPTPLLDYIVAGNTTAIEALDMDAALRQFILGSLRGSSGPARRRRTDG
jgi:hypothetical protein